MVGVHEFFDQSPDYFYVVLKRMEGGVVLDRIVTKVWKPPGKGKGGGGGVLCFVVADFCQSVWRVHYSKGSGSTLDPKYKEHFDSSQNIGNLLIEF